MLTDPLKSNLLGVGVDSELDRGVDFSWIEVGGCLNQFSGWGFHPRLTTPCHLAAESFPSFRQGFESLSVRHLCRVAKKGHCLFGRP